MKIPVIKVISSIFLVISLTFLYLSSLYNYLLFHTISEMFSICIAFTVFMVSWNSIRYIKNNYLILIGVAYFFIGFLDLFHAMSYKGMNIFTDYDYYANQLWIAARYMESITLLLAFTFAKSKKKVSLFWLFSIYTMITTLIMVSIFWWKIFPVCFVDDLGLTPFKKYSEYIICFILFISIIVLLKNKDVFEGIVYKYLLFSIVFTIMSELAFTIYIDNYGLSNLVGHYFKIFSFYLIYKSIIVKGVQEPYDIIFREMKLTEEKLFEQNVVLKNQASKDGLTGLYNHRYIYDCLEEEIKRCRITSGTLVIMILDIDHFKNINDTYGHRIGDNILGEISQILKDNTRKRDIVGRYGGEEFLIILADTSEEEGFRVAEKIRGKIQNNEFVQKIHLTISIGVQAYTDEKVGELVEKVDKKLYKAKNSGRNKTVI